MRHLYGHYRCRPPGLDARLRIQWADPRQDAARVFFGNHRESGGGNFFGDVSVEVPDDLIRVGARLRERRPHSSEVTSHFFTG